MKLSGQAVFPGEGGAVSFPRFATPEPGGLRYGYIAMINPRARHVRTSQRRRTL
jgi:hypothetical protein